MNVSTTQTTQSQSTCTAATFVLRSTTQQRNDFRLRISEVQLMPRAASAETQLRHCKRELNERTRESNSLKAKVRQLESQLTDERKKISELVVEVSEWKRRFDALLKLTSNSDQTKEP